VKTNYFVDLGMAIAFLFVLITGILKYPGLLPAFGIYHSELPMAQISRLHDWSGIILATLVFLHLALHWTWIVRTTKRIVGW